jgi:hypothetical protein
VELTAEGAIKLNLKKPGFAEPPATQRTRPWTVVRVSALMVGDVNRRSDRWTRLLGFADGECVSLSQVV